MKTNVLVTGVTGFIGSHLVTKLLTMGVQVHALVRPSSRLDMLSAPIRKKVVFHVHNGENSLQTIMENVQPQLVVHLASLFLSRHKQEDVEPLLESNVIFGTMLLEAMVHCGVRNFINTGTAWQHYQNANYNPVNLYAATKEAFGDILRYYEEAQGVKSITLQLFDTYGEGDRRRKIFTLLREAAENGVPLEMSPGEQLMDCVHVDDVTEAFVLAMQYLLANQYEFCGTYAVSAGVAVPLKKIVERYEKILGKPIPVLWGKRTYREREVMVPWNEYKILPGWKRQHRDLM